MLLLIKLLSIMYNALLISLSNLKYDVLFFLHLNISLNISIINSFSKVMKIFGFQ